MLNILSRGLLGKYGKPATEKKVLTVEQQDNLLAFARNSNIYNFRYPMMQIMFGTCMRPSELIGLPWDNVDLENKEIHVCTQLIYAKIDGKYQFHESAPKTEAGVRDIPMTDRVYEAFLMQCAINETLGRYSELKTEKYQDNIFLTKRNRPIMPAGINSFLLNVVDAYNEEEEKKARNEGRKPDLLPKTSAYTCRHTGCTRMAEKNVNPKVMQTVMRHSDISITMNTYNHASDKRTVKDEMQKMD